MVGNETVPKDERPVVITTPDGQAEAFLFQPDRPGAFPAVILHTDIRGIRPAFLAHGRRLADAGYRVLLPNLYYRLAAPPVVDPALPFRDEGVQARLGILRKSLSPSGLHRDHLTFLDYLAALPGDAGAGVAIVGYCFSGAIAVNAAADFPDRIVAAASFHGGRLATDEPDSPHRRAAEIRARLYFGHATDDASMPAEAIARLAEALSAAGVRFRSEVYPARHGWAVADSPAYDRAAAERHWTALLDHLALAFARP